MKVGFFMTEMFDKYFMSTLTHTLSWIARMINYGLMRYVCCAMDSFSDMDENISRWNISRFKCVCVEWTFWANRWHMWRLNTSSGCLPINLHTKSTPVRSCNNTTISHAHEIFPNFLCVVKIAKSIPSCNIMFLSDAKLWPTNSWGVKSSWGLVLYPHIAMIHDPLEALPTPWAYKNTFSQLENPQKVLCLWPGGVH